VGRVASQVLAPANAAPHSRGWASLTPSLRSSPVACEFYKQVEAIKTCGIDGYASGYGLKYCERFSRLGPQQLSADSLKWGDETLVCLQTELREYVISHPNATCRDLAAAAFKSHTACYVAPGGAAPGVCQLPARDMFTIAFDVVDGPDLAQPRSLAQAFAVALYCIGMWGDKLLRDAIGLLPVSK
jgi:hypothetical protein